jgi:hypothetical protein
MSTFVESLDFSGITFYRDGQHGSTLEDPHRIAENIDVFDFELFTDELAAIDVLDTSQRGGPEPESIRLETLGRPIPED